MIKKIPILFESGVGSGLLLILMALSALMIVNSPWGNGYTAFFDYPLGFSWHGLALTKPIVLWINDGLMAIFFLVVGLEIKHELIDGELNSLSKASLPLFAALGGMLIPACIYLMINAANPAAHQGWAIPSATDIAFTLAIFAMLRSRVPPALKALITALAIIDDLGAIVIIACFYTQSLSWLSLGLAAFICLLLFILNRQRVRAFTPYAILGVLLWLCVLKSGVHATLAGVVLAWAYPHGVPVKRGRAQSASIEHKLNPWVNYAILPLFAFANAGVSFQGQGWSILFSSITLGIAAGLFIGKQIGIMGFSWLAIRLRLAHMPSHSTWMQFYGAAVLCGIGFTMSLFIGSLAFDQQGDLWMQHVRTGVLLGSLLSGILGAGLLRYASTAKA